MMSSSAPLSLGSPVSLGWSRKSWEPGKNARVEDVEEFYPPNPGAGLRWLAVRRPEVYRERVETKHTLSAGDTHLKLLEQIEERGKRERIEHKQLLIDRYNALDAEPGPIEV